MQRENQTADGRHVVVGGIGRHRATRGASRAAAGGPAVRIGGIGGIVVITAGWRIVSRRSTVGWCARIVAVGRCRAWAGLPGGAALNHALGHAGGDWRRRRFRPARRWWWIARQWRRPGGSRMSGLAGLSRRLCAIVIGRSGSRAVRQQSRTCRLLRHYPARTCDAVPHRSP